MQHVARVLNKKNGDNLQRRKNLYANVKTIYFRSIEEKSLLTINYIVTNDKEI